MTQKLAAFIHNLWYTVFMSVLTLYTIFAIDIDKAFFNVQASIYFSSVHLVAIGLFVAEVILMSVTRNDYFGKFYFWIDCFSTLTMFLQIIWIQNLMSSSSDVTVAISFAKVTKASRLSKIGARSSKIMKLIRLIKLLKFFNKQQPAKQKDKIIQNSQKSNPNIQQQDCKQQSNQNQYNQQNEEQKGSQQDREQEQKQKSEQNDQFSQSQQSSPSFKCQTVSKLTFLNGEKNGLENDRKGYYKNASQRQQNKNQEGENEHTQSQPREGFQNEGISRKDFPTQRNFHNQKEQVFQLPQSFGQIHQLSQDGQNNIEDIMKVFFTQNINKLVKQGRNISTTNINNKSINKDMHPIKEQISSKFDRNQNTHNKILIPIPQKNSLLPRLKHIAKNPSKLSFNRRKQLIDFSQNHQGRQKAHRNNARIICQAPFSNMPQKLQKCISLPPLSRPNVDPVKQSQIQSKYLKLVQKQDQQPKAVLSCENLKVGQVLKQQIQKNIVIMVMGLIMILPIITAGTWFDQDSTLSMTANLFVEDIGEISGQQAKIRMMESFIEAGLEMNSPLEYFSIPVNETCCEFPRDFPKYVTLGYIYLDELRLSEQAVFIDRNITIIFSKKKASQITSYLNLGRSFFITLLLIFCSVLFMKDIENYALNPLQKMSSLINKISNNPFDALKQINVQKNQKIQDFDDQEHKLHLYNRVKNEEDYKLQTNILSDAIIKITSLLTIGAGEIGSEIISKNIKEVGNKKQSITDAYQMKADYRNRQKNIVQSQVGVYAYIQFRSFQKFCDVFGDQIFKYINNVTEIIHTHTIQFGGVPIEYDGKGFLLLWKSDTEIKGFQTSRKTVKKDRNNNESDITQEKQRQHEILAKLSVLAIHSLTKITLQLNRLQQSRCFYQAMLQKFSKQQNLSTPGRENPFFHGQNYEPHLFSSSIHVGESFYGSMGSQYKLQCKCVGYDVSYTRWLCELLEKESYGVGNLISKDVYLLLEEFGRVAKRLNVRKIDSLKIKQFRFRDRVINPNINYMSDHQLQSIPCQKVTNTSIYTFDFSGKLQLYISNESQIIHLYPDIPSINLDQSHTLHCQDLQNPNEKRSNMSNKYQLHSSMTPLLLSLEQPQAPNKIRSLQAYSFRESWLKAIEQCTMEQVLRRLQSQNRDIVQARKSFQPQFYENWVDSLECYYAAEFAQALKQFKFLHTYNQFYHDYTARIFVNRIENMNVEEQQMLRNRKNQGGNSLSDSSISSEEDGRKNKWSGAKQVVWKI